ncbi:MAG: hypothetical protein Q8N08_07375, partial [Methanobacteriaceae archaeon]|nr:hypothetical protein [Methanobacteriaceae archaeon]
MEGLLWWLIAGNRGGINRARIINELQSRPYNANQLAKSLGLDYKTAQTTDDGCRHGLPTRWSWCINWK